MAETIKVQGVNLEFYIRLDGLILLKIGRGKYYTLQDMLGIIQENLEYKEGNTMCNGVYYNCFGYSNGSNVPSRNQLKEEIEAAIAVAVSLK